MGPVVDAGEDLEAPGGTETAAGVRKPVDAAAAACAQASASPAAAAASRCSSLPSPQPSPPCPHRCRFMALPRATFSANSSRLLTA